MRIEKHAKIQPMLTPIRRIYTVGCVFDIKK